MNPYFDRADRLRKSRTCPAKSLIFLKRGSRERVRKSPDKRLNLLASVAAAELPPITPLRARARVRAARVRVQELER